VLRATRSANMDLAFAYDGGVISPALERIVVGRFARAGRAVILVVNVGGAGYDGVMMARDAAKWIVGDPATGTIGPVEADRQGRIVLSLPPRATRILVGPPGAASP